MTPCEIGPTSEMLRARWFQEFKRSSRAGNRRCSHPVGGLAVMVFCRMRRDRPPTFSDDMSEDEAVARLLRYFAATVKAGPVRDRLIELADELDAGKQRRTLH